MNHISKYDLMRIMVWGLRHILIPWAKADYTEKKKKKKKFLSDRRFTLAIDYLGEAGVGAPIYGTIEDDRPYPCVSAGWAL